MTIPGKLISTRPQNRVEIPTHTVTCIQCRHSEVLTANCGQPRAGMYFRRRGWSLRQKHWTCPDCAPQKYRHTYLTY